jgi:amidase
MPTTHFLGADRVATAFSASFEPALCVEPGDVVTLETTDSAYRRLHEGVDPDDIEDEAYNAVTGPVFVRGAQPGDALEIHVLSIGVLRAWALWTPGFGPLGEYTNALHIRPLAIVQGGISLSDRLRVPLEPMIGCIGLAPAKGTSSTFMPAYPWGGNMDLRELSAGARLLLPVQVRGALLGVGDVHAAMGAGEPTWLSVETAARVTVRLGIHPGLCLQGPRLLLTRETIEVVVVDQEEQDHEDAQELAVRRAYAYLRGEWGLDSFEAYAYCCARVGVRFGGPASPIVLAVIPHPWERQMT